MLAESTFTTTHHIGTLVGFALCTAALVAAGLKNDRVTRYVFATLSMGAWLLSSIFYVLPANIEPDKSLPIQACDLLALFAAITLVLPSRFMKAVMYFGGFGMTTQAFATPTSDIGAPDNIKFWIFWLLHGVILACAIYIVVVNKYRPAIKDFVTASVFWFIYALLMVALNYGTYAAGFNDGQGWYYGYLGPTLPEIVQGSILRHLGDWPVRPMLMMLIILAMFVLVYLPWVLIPKRKEESGDQSDASPAP